MPVSPGIEGLIYLPVLTGIYCVITPISIYYVYRLRQLSLRNVPWFSKRHPKLIIFNAILFNLYPTIFRPISDYICAIFEPHEPMYPLGTFLANLTQWYLLLEYMRLWLLYYDYKYQTNSLSLKWKHHILKEQTSTPWTHKYKWLGNVKMLCIINIFFCLLFVTIIVGAFVIYGVGILNIMQAVPMLCTMFMLIIAFKVRKCKDEFMILKEFQIYGFSLILMIILYIIIAVTVAYRTILRWILMNMYCCLTCYVMIFVSTHWVIKQYEKRNEYHRQMLAQKHLSDPQIIIAERLTLEQLLSNKDWFDVFANHLIKEFSIENLLFVFEMVQIKNELVAHNLVEKENIGVTFGIDFHRIDSLRRKDSYIYSIDEMKNNIEYIMKQYIDINGEYCINISSYVRDRLHNEYKKLNDSIDNVVEFEMIQTQTYPNNVHNDEIEKKHRELAHQYVSLFDMAMEDVIQLMRSDSLARFYDTSEYEIMAKEKL